MSTTQALPPVVDGHVAHSHGRLPLLLTGIERARAHVDLLVALSASTNDPPAVERFVQLARQDPSLLLEPVPDHYPLRGVSGEPLAWTNSDQVWKYQARWHGNWLCSAVQANLPLRDAVEVVLQAGVHPDDAAVWPAGRLLLVDGWVTDPDRLSLALQHGASPDSGLGWLQSYLRTALLEVSKQLDDGADGSIERIERAIRPVELLLDAGTTERAYLPGETEDTSWMGTLCRTAISHLTGKVRVKGSDFIAPVLRLIRRMHAEGFAIDEDTGGARVPPVVSALRQGSIDVACEFIRLGCRTDVARAGGPGHSGIESLESEAAALGPDVLARINQALMERALDGAPQKSTRRAMRRGAAI